MNENKLVGFDPQIFKEQKQVVEALFEDNEIEDEKVYEENIENMLDYLEDEEEEEIEDGEQE